MLLPENNCGVELVTSEFVEWQLRSSWGMEEVGAYMGYKNLPPLSLSQKMGK